MTLQYSDEQPDPDVLANAHLLSRRTVLRRSMLGMTGIALAPLLAACGDEDEDPEDAVDEAADPPEAPDIDPEEPGMDAPDDAVEDNADD